MGVELLLIDSKSTTIQGFISTHFLPRFKEDLKPNTVYKLNGFSIRPSKSVYRVSPHKHGISFNNKTTFAPVHEVDYQIDSQHFRIRDLQAFTDIVDKHTDLLDIIGFLRVINGDNLETQTPMATAPAPAGERSKDMVFLHVQLEDGETARVYLWDKIAAAFRSRWNDSKTKPTVILLTTLNSKTLGGVVTLSSTASTRLFFDSDIIETEKLLRYSSAAVTKVETVASFICTATITDVMEEYGWYFISCTACKWQLERSETTFICPNFKCKKPNTVGLIRYRFEVKVCDDSGNEGTFVIFDKEALKLVVRQAPDVMNEMSESGENGSNEDSGTATPQCVLDIVGRTCKFQVKVNDFNFKSARTTATVSRIIDDDVQNEKNDGKRQRLN
ncbi:BnaC09g30680D [Brassica napus]|uniref:BnaC09g30680D protein n=1 Tax=Brassica napus TaxID=3708 RepID=A0A078G122_BRANA|nr:BnaC09g30680D [Brassica napus]